MRHKDSKDSKNTMTAINAEAEDSHIVDFESIAASAYRAYAAVTDNKNFRGEEMPKWDDLPEPIRIAWEAAARHVANLTNWNIKDAGKLQELEASWKGWKPE